MDKKLFKAEVKKQLTLRNWSYEDLSAHTKYTCGSIRTMMCTPSKLTKSAMQNIADALGIPMEDDG